MKKTFNKRSLLFSVICFVMLFCFCFMASAQDEHTHIYGEWEVTTNPTCSTTGIKTKTCLIDGCDATVDETVSIVPSNHVAAQDAEWVVKTEAACGINGKLETTCIYCKTKFTKSTPALSHNLDENGWTIIKQAVCSADGVEIGSREQFCNICNKTIRENYAPEHSWQDESEWELISNGTCTSYASYNVVCTVCGTTKVEFGTEYAEHTFSGEPYYIVEPTCMTQGVGIDSCDVCGKIIKGMTVGNNVDAGSFLDEYNSKYHVFDYKKIIRGGQCSYDLVYCTVCKTYIEIPYEEYSHHNFITESHKNYKDYPEKLITNASCIAEGVKEKWCLDCKDYVVVKTPKNSSIHKYNSVILKMPTCLTEGLRMNYCELNFGHVSYEVIPATGHRYNTEWEIVKMPTCLEDGLKVNYCLTCKMEIEEAIPYVSAEIEPYENKYIHSFDLETENIITQPTCTTEGLAEYHCDDCDKDIKTIIPKHYASLWEYKAQRNATCTLEGAIYYICKDCSTYIEEVIPLNFDEEYHAYSVTVEPTCISEGVAVCLRNKRHTKAIQKNEDAHLPGDNWTVTVRATCEKQGEKATACTRCGDTVTQKVAATGHKAGEWQRTYLFDCTVGGTLVQYCQNCPKLLGEKKVPAGEHSFTGVWEFVSGDCLNGGTIAQTCTICHYTEEKQSPAGVHVPYAIIDTVEAKCSAKGYDIAVCACGKEHININETEKKMHTWIEKVQGVEATCTENGVAPIKVCVTCFAIVGGDTIDALGHDFSVIDEETGTATCSRCTVNKVGSGEDGEDIICECMCHSTNFIVKIYYKIVTFFNKLLKKNQVCACGLVNHY